MEEERKGATTVSEEDEIIDVTTISSETALEEGEVQGATAASPEAVPEDMGIENLVTSLSKNFTRVSVTEPESESETSGAQGLSPDSREVPAKTPGASKKPYQSCNVYSSSIPNSRYSDITESETSSIQGLSPESREVPAKTPGASKRPYQSCNVYSSSIPNSRYSDITDDDDLEKSSLPKITKISSVSDTIDLSTGISLSDTKSDKKNKGELAEAATVSSASLATLDSADAGACRRRRIEAWSSSISENVCDPRYEFSDTLKEDHGGNLFAIQFHQQNKYQALFATAGTNRLSIYECLYPTGIRLLRMYADPAVDESFYSLAWSYTSEGLPVVAVAGKNAIIRLIYPTNPGYSSDETSYTGHGYAIHHLTFCGTKPYLLLSASRDHDMRLWNIETHICLAILGGVKGHQAQALYAEFNLDGSRVVSCGKDHSLKLWNLDKPKMQEAIENSSKYNYKSRKSFPVYRDHNPVFSTIEIHQTYADCVLDFGKFIISKSCENEVVMWRPGHDGLVARSSKKNPVTVVTRLPVRNADIHFLRISLDRMKKNMALGNRIGKIYLWDLDVDDYREIKPSILQHPACTTAVRQTSFSPDSKTLIACCDDGTVWRWDLIQSAKADP